MRQEVIVAGFGGQGILLIGELICFAAIKEDKHACWVPSYGAEMRGGTARCSYVISDRDIASPMVEAPDILVAMNLKSLVTFAPAVKAGGTIIVNSSLVKDIPEYEGVKIVQVPVNGIARELGNDRCANMVMLGAIAGYSKAASIDSVVAAVAEFFGNKYPGNEKIVDLNKRAVVRGTESVK